jgi:hypothetical protein
MENENHDKTTPVVAVNMALLIIYSIVIRVVNIHKFDSTLLVVIIVYHFIFCTVLTILGLIGLKPLSPYQKGFFLSALILLLIGCSTCFFSVFGH